MWFGDNSVFYECGQNCCKSFGFPIHNWVLENLFWIPCKMCKTPEFTGVWQEEQEHSLSRFFGR